MPKNVSEMVQHPSARYALLLVLGLLSGLMVYRQMAERPLWAYFTLLIIALVPLALFLTNRRVVHLFGLVVIGMLLSGVYLCDVMQETESEQVMRIAQELLRATENADYGVFDRYLADDYRWQSMNKQAMMNRVRSSLLPSTARSCSLSSARVKVQEPGRRFLLEGNLSASGRFGHEEGFFSGTLELTFAKQAVGGLKVVSTRVAWYNGGEVTIPR